ncbi:hypothetical protein MBLNU13_g00143t1 [Cladosporium sp. NU13]
MTVVTGILDSVTFTTYHVFTTKQTGNFLFIAIYIFSKENLAFKIEQTIAVSISSFIIGSFIFGQLAHRVRTRRRSWLLLTTLFQALLVLVVALVERSGVPGQETGPRALAIVGLLSFAQAGQVSLAIGVGLAELNTTMITGAVISTLGDPRIFHANNHARDRRILFVIAYLAGCFAGSALNAYDTTWAFFLAFGMKMFICATFLFTPGMVADLEKQDNEGTRTPVSHILWGD